ncbi:DNRLRE domain-containing protein, partial [Rhodococcus rhodochrous]|uniref:DNRLRE domain-containing protein n=1 Tax=Rhodococcus rhodochrous TaxID=1829 RepID=UPI0012FD4A4A
MPVVTLTWGNTLIKDSYVTSGSDVNRGTDTTLIVGAGSRSYIKFDLGLIPNNAIINSATLKLTGVNVSIPNEARTHKIQRVTSDWSDTTITGNKQPSTTTEGEQTYTIPVRSSDYTQSYNIKSLVQEWVNGVPNYGLVLLDVNESDGKNLRHTFVSNDNGSTQSRPTITIDYTIPTTGKKQVEYISTRTPVYQSSSSSITIPWPTGVQVGDTVFAQIAISSNSYTVTLPSGWKLEYTVNSSPYRFIIASKVLESGDTSPTFSVTSPVTWYGTLHLFRNVKSVNKITGRESGNTTQLQPTLSSLTATVPNTIAVIFNGMYSSLP